MFRHWLFLLRALMRLAGAFLQSYSLLRFRGLKDLDPDIVQALRPEEKRRLSHYYLGSTYLGAIFGSIRGRKLSITENRRFLKLSALAAFFDDMVEVKRNQTVLPADQALTPQTFALLNDERGVALKLLEQIQHNCPPIQLDLFTGYMERVFAVEMQGLSAVGTAFGPTELQEITAEKGGCSVLLFRSVLEPAPTKEEERALQEFGYMIQLSDDIFDVWFDLQNGVETLATQCCKNGDLGELKRLFESQVGLAKAAIRSIRATKGQSGTSLGILHVLTAITRSCLEHYERLQNVYHKLPTKRREYMVMDMEKWGNRLRVARALFLQK